MYAKRGMATETIQCYAGKLIFNVTAGQTERITIYIMKKDYTIICTYWTDNVILYAKVYNGRRAGPELARFPYTLLTLPVEFVVIFYHTWCKSHDPNDNDGRPSAARGRFEFQWMTDGVPAIDGNRRQRHHGHRYRDRLEKKK